VVRLGRAAETTSASAGACVRWMRPRSVSVSAPNSTHI